MSVQRAKAVIDSLSGQTVTNEKAEKIIRLYVNNENAPAADVADAFLRSVTRHIKDQCRAMAGRQWEASQSTRATAESAGYDEMPSEPEQADPA